MELCEMLPAAAAFARRCHSGQNDRQGLPYILHPLAVLTNAAEHPRYPSLPPAEKTYVACIAILHDVIEDTPAVLADIDALLGCPEITAGVEAMTHFDDETLESYWARARANPLARLVKLCDIQHNSEPTRLPENDPEYRARLLDKYARAEAFLRYEE